MQLLGVRGLRGDGTVLTLSGGETAIIENVPRVDSGSP